MPYTPPTAINPNRIPEQVPPLIPANVRWFTRDSMTYWKPFSGYDSNLLEQRYQHLMTHGDGGNPNEWIVTVRGDMYDVNLQDNTIEAIFWKGVCGRDGEGRDGRGEMQGSGDFGGEYHRKKGCMRGHCGG